MKNISMNIWVMAVCWVLVTAFGFYYTFQRQPAELEHLEKAEKVAKMKNAELVSLETEHASLAHMAENAVRKWRARYKVIPEELTTADVVGYFNELTTSGFKNFDVTFSGRRETSDYSVYTFDVRGRAYYNSLYRLIWELENNRNFYRVKDLTLDHIDLVSTVEDLGTEKLDVMVSFTGQIEAYFNGIEGASAPPQFDATFYEDRAITVKNDDLPPVPFDLLPDVQPATNPFYPAILERIPPNTYNRIDVEQAELVSIAGDKAIFQDAEGIRSASVGDKVYLGQITEVDPGAGRVVARLNKGGLIDEVIRELETEDAYRQAMGPARLSPLN